MRKRSHHRKLPFYDYKKETLPSEMSKYYMEQVFAPLWKNDPSYFWAETEQVKAKRKEASNGKK